MFIDPSLNLIVLIELVLIVPVLIPQVLIALVLLALVQIFACVAQKLAPAKIKIAEIYLPYLPLLFASLTLDSIKNYFFTFSYFECGIGWQYFLPDKIL